MQQVEGLTTLLRRQAGQQAVFAQQVAHQPAAVAARCAKACSWCFNDGNAQFRGMALEVIRRPEPGVTGSDNDHVDIQIVLKRRPGCEIFPELVHP